MPDTNRESQLSIVRRLRAWILRPRQEWHLTADGFDLTMIAEPYCSLRWALRRRRELKAMARSVGVKIRVRIERVPMDVIHARNDEFLRDIRARCPDCHDLSHGIECPTCGK